ncbi:MAG: hypothetical protein GKR89_25515, partial [Candidatus Latescibacteria bacterium]|nr:hypothetical protein [Candidatus Latescibacterota bacterium]
MTLPPISPLPRNGTWRSYTAADGLAGLQVEYITEDQDGFLWFATLNGASRFDGDTFENFNSRNGLRGDQISGLLLGVSRKISTPHQVGVGSMWTNHLGKAGHRTHRRSNAAIALW